MAALTRSDAEALIDDLSQLLPFPTTTYTDMGADDWTPQLYFGPVDPDSGLPLHRAGIDANTDDPSWWIDYDAGMRTIVLEGVGPGDLRNVVARILRP